MKIIDLSNGKAQAQVSDEDYERLSQYKWQLVRNSAHNENRMIYYARRWQRDDQVEKSHKYRCIFMHREITGLPPGDMHLVVHHVDENGLNNQRENLRVVTFSENLKMKRNQQRKSGVKYKKKVAS